MNKELQKYINKHLKPKPKRLSHSIANSIKCIFFEECDEDSDIDELLPILNKENKKSHKEIVTKKQEKLIYDYIDLNDFEDFTNSINDKDLKTYIHKHQEYSNFQKTLFKLIDERNLKDSDVYNKVHLDRRMFSKIRNDTKYHPSKETIILLGISLKLSQFELERLLESASYSLPKNNKFDLIIRFCFIHKIFDIIKINEYLEEYNCDLLNY
jgi:hypothetical protein